MLKDKSEVLHILLVDDDKVDIIGIKRAFEKHSMNNPILVANNGLIALEMLRGKHEHLSISKPPMILLDLNTPCMNGFEFLEEIHKDESLRQSKVFVLTTSTHEVDRLESYNFNIFGYIKKSDLLNRFTHALERIKAH